jgi:hypothetical protein
LAAKNGSVSSFGELQLGSSLPGTDVTLLHPVPGSQLRFLNVIDLKMGFKVHWVLTIDSSLDSTLGVRFIAVGATRESKTQASSVLGNAQLLRSKTGRRLVLMRHKGH